MWKRKLIWLSSTTGVRGLHKTIEARLSGIVVLQNKVTVLDKRCSVRCTTLAGAYRRTIRRLLNGSPLRLNRARLKPRRIWLSYTATEPGLHKTIAALSSGTVVLRNKVTSLGK